MTVFLERAVREYSGLQSRGKRREEEGSKIQPSQKQISGIKKADLLPKKQVPQARSRGHQERHQESEEIPKVGTMN